MTTNRLPHKWLNSPLGTETTVASISGSGAATFPSVTTSAISLDIASTAAIAASAYPVSGFTFLQVDSNGSTLFIPAYTSAF